MKNIIRFLLVIAVMVALILPVSAAQSATMTVSVSDSSVTVGETFTVSVRISSVSNCTSGGFKFSFDRSVFTYVSGSCALSGFSGGVSTANNNVAGYFMNGNATVSGNVWTITLKVKDGAAKGSYTISGTPSMKADGADVSCSVSSATVTIACSHSYDNSCDEACNSCGAERSITHSWNAGQVIQKATCTEAGKKTLTCKVCGATTTESISKTSHKYDNGCDKDCNVCGKTRSTSHDFVWECDASEHWQECANCGEEKEHGAHSPADELSGNELGHGHACSICGLIPDSTPHGFQTDCDPLCPECGFTRTVTHSYSEQWSFDPGGHFHACSICGDKLEKYAHVPGEAATETTDQICTDCGFVIEVSGNHEHVKTGEWLSDDKGHWFLCTCYAYTDPVAHTWDKGKIDELAGKVTYKCTECGYTKDEIYVPETTPETQPTVGASEYAIPKLYVFVVLGVLSVSLIVNVVLIVLICVKGRKGKFKK